VSKDGRLAVDGRLQVYDVHSAEVVVSFSTHRAGAHHATTSTTTAGGTGGPAADDCCLQLVRLTADGKYVA